MANLQDITAMLRQMGETRRAAGQMMLEKAKAQGEGWKGLGAGIRDAADFYANKQAFNKKMAAEEKMNQDKINAEKLMASEREITNRTDIRHNQWPPTGGGADSKDYYMDVSTNSVLNQVAKALGYTKTNELGETIRDDALMLQNKDKALREAFGEVDFLVSNKKISADAAKILKSNIQILFENNALSGDNGQKPAAETAKFSRDVTGEQIDRYAKSLLSPYSRSYRIMTDAIKAGNIDAANRAASAVKANIENANLENPVKQGLIDRFTKTLTELGMINTLGMGASNTRPR